MELARLDNVTKSYGTKDGVRDLSLTIRTGEVIGLLGLNGAGKSTTLKLLSGLLFPTKGTILVEGKAPRDNRGLIAFHSEIDAIYPWMAPKDGAFLMEGLFDDFDRAKFERLLEVLNVPNTKASEMSKGQKSRFRLALTLGRTAKLILLDEPLSGIDILSRKQIMAALVSEVGKTSSIIFSTHEVEVAEELFDRVLIIKDGRLAADLTKEKIDASGKSIVDTFTEVFSESN